MLARAERHAGIYPKDFFLVGNFIVFYPYGNDGNRLRNDGFIILFPFVFPVFVVNRIYNNFAASKIKRGIFLQIFDFFGDFLQHFGFFFFADNAFHKHSVVKVVHKIFVDVIPDDVAVVKRDDVLLIENRNAAASNRKESVGK